MAQDTTLPHGKPGIASFATESYGGPGEPRFGDTPTPTTTELVTAGAALDLPIFSVVSVIAGVLALAVLGAATGSATGTLTISSTGPVNDEIITINGRVYTFKTALSTGPTVEDEILLGGTINDTAQNVADAINADADAIGTGFSEGTVIHPDVFATVASAVVTFIARESGDEGNAITLVETGTNLAVSGATLTGGDDDADIKPFGILASPVVMTNGQSMSVPIYRGGDWDMDQLNWDATYETDESKRRAFEGSLSPNIFIQKKKFNNDQIAV